MKTAFIFDGQGAQKPGMGKDLVENYSACGRVFTYAQECMKLDFCSICFGERTDLLSQIKFAQPAIMVMSLAIFELLKEYGIYPSAVAGHSLGEYAALTASEMVSLKDAFYLIRVCAEEVQICSSEQNAMMCAVLGVSPELICAVCEQIPGVVKPTNYNCPEQTVISGEMSAVKQAIDKLKGKAKRMIPLKIPGAFHTEMMHSAAASFQNKTEKICTQSPKYDFYSGIQGKRLENLKVSDYFSQHMVQPILFTDMLHSMEEDGIHRYVEIGPGRGISRFVKSTLPEADSYYINDETSFRKYLNKVKNEK